jgi:RND family efflux transporter MFP subunit
MFRDQRLLFGCALAFAGALSSGCNQETAAAAKKTEAPKVTVAHPTFAKVADEEYYNGWLKANATVEVRARVRGHIKKVYFHDGDAVTKGQLLFELDPRPFQAEIDQAKAQTKAIEAQRVSLAADVSRYTELVKSKAVTQQQLDKAVADLGYAVAQIAAMNEVVKSKELDLEYSQIKAEISGRIGRAMLTEGNLVNAGGSDPILATIVAINPISLYFSVDESALQNFRNAEYAQEKEGSKPDDRPLRERKYPVWFALDTDEGFPHKAFLDFANPQVDAATGTVELRAEVPNDNDALAPGYRARVRVPLSQPHEASLVPDLAINTDQQYKYLLVVDAKNEVKRCDVKLGRLQDDGLRVITSAVPPLEKNTKVIVEGMQRARLNYPVQPIEEPKATHTAAN